MRRTLLRASSITTRHPFTGAVVAETPMDTPESIKAKFEAAKVAQREWKKVSIDERSGCIQRFRDLLDHHTLELAEIMSSEMGKPVHQAAGEIKATLPRINYFLDHVREETADRVQREAGVESGGTLEVLRHEPLGVVANVSAWNFPYFVGSNVWVPGLLTGNAVMYKPSEWTCLTGKRVGELMVESGVPADLFPVIQGDGRVAHHIFEHDINGLFFTGSNATGAKLAQAVATKMIRVQLELGGKDPCYVADDVADVKGTAAAVADGAFYNAGQSCCSVERVYVHENIYDEFVEAAVAFAASLKVGDPSDPKTYMGPLALPNQPKFLADQVADAVSKGAKVLHGGVIDESNPRFFPPTVVVDVDHTMDIVKNESFGPVMPIMKVSSDAEALEKMDNTTYGLTCSVFSSSQERAESILRELDAGTAYWNCCDRVTPFLPWSGRRGSGVGSTLSPLGIHAFTQPKGYHFRE